MDHPAAIGEPSGHGLGWGLDRGGVVGHGGGTIGVANVLRTSPKHGVAAVVLTNGESGGALAEGLLAPWFAALAGVSPPTAFPTPDGLTPISDSSRYLGRYENRQHRFEVERDEVTRLWLRDIPQGDSIEMAMRAGITARTQRHELRRLTGEVFVMIDGSGVAIGPVEFLGRDHRDRARFLFVSERAVPRAQLRAEDGRARPPQRRPMSRVRRGWQAVLDHLSPPAVCATGRESDCGTDTRSDSKATPILLIPSPEHPLDSASRLYSGQFRS